MYWGLSGALATQSHSEPSRKVVGSLGCWMGVLGSWQSRESGEQGREGRSRVEKQRASAEVGSGPQAAVELASLHALCCPPPGHTQPPCSTLFLNTLHTLLPEISTPLLTPGAVHSAISQTCASCTNLSAI